MCPALQSTAGLVAPARQSPHRNLQAASSPLQVVTIEDKFRANGVDSSMVTMESFEWTELAIARLVHNCRLRAKAELQAWADRC